MAAAPSAAESGRSRDNPIAATFVSRRLLNKEGPQELIVNAIDTPDVDNHARGKQTMKPGGIFYTPASGIWQTVWTEPVNNAFIENVRAEPDIDNGTVTIGRGR